MSTAQLNRTRRAAETKPEEPKPQAATPRLSAAPAERTTEKAAAVAGAFGLAAAATLIARAVRGRSDEEILQQMRARRTMLKEVRPDASGARHVERVGGPAPRRRGI